MECYICSWSASLCCPACGRYVCKYHTRYWGITGKYDTHYFCDNCVKSWEPPETPEARERRVKEKKERAEKRVWCDLCAGPALKGMCWDDIESGSYFGSRYYKIKEEGYSNLRCHNCKRLFCRKHGQVIYSCSADSTDYWCRCIDHLRKHNILGEHEVVWESLFLGKPDWRGAGWQTD